MILTAALVALPATALVRVDAGDDQYHFIVGLFDKGLHSMVVDEGRKFLGQYRGHPKSELAQYRIGLALFELDEFAQAEPYLSHLVGIDQFEYRGECALRLGQCQVTRGDDAGAARSFRIVLESGQDYLEEPGHYLLAETLLGQGEFDKASRHYQAALEAGESGRSGGGAYQSDAQRGLVWCAFRLGKYDDAASLARAALGSDSPPAIEHELRFLLAESLFESGHSQSALDVYADAGPGPFADAVLRGRGFALAELGRPRESAAAFAELTAKYQDSPHVGEAALQGGIQLYEAGDLSSAAAALAHSSLASDPDAGYWRARVAVDSGDIDGALQLLAAALRNGPSAELKSEIHSLRGDALTRTGRADEATRAYREAGSDYALHAAAIAALNSGNADGAVRLARQFLDSHPDSQYAAPTRMALAEALFARKAYDQAAPLFEQLASSAEPEADRARAANRAAWCLYLTPESRAEAGDAFAAVARAHPESAEVPEAIFMSAQAYNEAGQTQGALRSWKRYAASYPDGSRLDQALLGLARLQAPEDAVATFERLLRERPESDLIADAHLELAELLTDLEQLDRAEEHYAALVRDHNQHPAAADALYGWAWSRFEAEDYPAAIEKLESLSRREDADAELRLATLELLIWSRCKTGSARRATEEFRQLASACDDDARLLETARVLSDALVAAGQAQEAESVLGNLGGSGNDAIASAVLVESVYVALQRGAVDDAEERVRRAQRSEPRSPEVAEACFFVGEALFEEGHMVRAAELYEHAAQVPECPVADRAAYKAGFSHLKRAEWQPAVDSFARLVDDHPKSELRGEGLYLLGECLFQSGRLDDAVARLQTLIESAPRHAAIPKAYFRQGLALAQLGRHEEASKTLSVLARRFPEFENGAEGELWRGKSLSALNRARPARQAFDRVIERAPGVLAARARLGIGRLELAAGNTEAALAEFLKVAVLYAHNEEVAEALFEAGRCLETLGDPERAAAQYREIIDRHSDASAAEGARARLRTLAGE